METMPSIESVTNQIPEFDPNPILKAIAEWYASQNEFVVIVIWVTLALLVIKLCLWLFKKVGKTVAIAIGIAYFLTSTALGATILSYIEKLNLG